MLTDTTTSKLKRLLLFGILPLFYTGLLLTYKHLLQSLHLNATDPPYAYLMNGTNLAGGYFEIGHTDHPGTPLQCFISVIVFLKHLISGQGRVYQDVILHPESYLQAICISLALLLGIVTYLTATYTYKHTGSIIMPLFFQLTPLFNHRSFFSASLPCAECLIIITSTFFMAYIYVNVLMPPSIENKNENKNKTYVFFGLFSALLIASKFTCIPLIFIPLFLAENSKQRIRYLTSLFFFFPIFIFPAITKLKDMFQWVWGLFLHEGHYGSGKADIMNIAAFKTSLTASFTTDVVFTFMYLLTSVALIAVLVASIKKIPLKPVYSRGIIGFWVTFTLNLVMVSKHYLFTYYVPLQCWFTLALILSYKSLSPVIKTDRFVLPGNKLVYIFLLVLTSVLIFDSVRVSCFGGSGNKYYVKTENFFDSHKDLPLIYTNNCGVSEVPALFFGIVYSGNIRPLYFEFAMKAYPKSYIYNIDGKNLTFWNVYSITPEIFKQYPKTLVYFKFWGKSNEDEINTMNDLCSWEGKKIVDYKKVYTDTITGESFYEISSDTTAIKKMLTKTLSVSCDMEKLTADKSQFLTDNENYKVKSAELVSQSEHHSGVNSVKLDKNTEYALDMGLNVSPDDFVTISIWEKSTNYNVRIVLTTDNSSFYTCSSAIINLDRNGWKQILCKYQIPYDFRGKTAKFYMYYTDKSECWLDDLEINVYQVK